MALRCGFQPLRWRRRGREHAIDRAVSRPAQLRSGVGWSGCVPTRGVAAVGKWPAGATAKSRAQAGHLSTAGVAREGVATADLRLWFEMQPLNPEHGDDDDQRQD